MFEEIVAKNFPNLKSINVHVWEAQRTGSNINSEIYTQTHHDKNVGRQRENLGSSKRKTTPVLKNISVRLIADFSEITEVRKQWDNLFRVLKEKKLSAAKLSFWNIGEIKKLLNKKRICYWYLCLLRNTKGISSGWKQVTSDSNLNLHRTARSITAGNYIIIKDNINAHFFFFH